jgi:hypothetical protein
VTKILRSTTTKSAIFIGQGYLRRPRCKYIISIGDKFTDVNTINFIGRGVVHMKLMVVTMALVAMTNISTNRACTIDENRSCWVRTVSQHYPVIGPCLPALPHYLLGLVLAPFLTSWALSSHHSFLPLGVIHRYVLDCRRRTCPPSRLPCTGPRCPP